ncbi:MAG TPA: hypothetical protein VGW33_13155 [Terriglobia bacterium]|nr:hypothetical protein [Terriglobia bacterium]
MEEKRLKAYFERESAALLARSTSDPDGFRAYFASHNPRDEEILGLLAISTMSARFPLRQRFPSPLEALAALSAPTRAELCEEFRRKLKTSASHLTAA